MAAVRSDSSTPADIDWEDTDFLLAGLPDFAGPIQPPVEAVGPTGRTVVPVVCVETQTDVVMRQSQGNMASPPASRWPTGVDARAAIALFRRPTDGRTSPPVSVDYRR
jgi:hypothetical protein